MANLAIIAVVAPLRPFYYGIFALIGCFSNVLGLLLDSATDAVDLISEGR